jgi:hypothetical protein
LRDWFDQKKQYIQDNYTNASGTLDWNGDTKTASVIMTANDYGGYAEFQDGVDGSYIENGRMYVEDSLLWQAFGSVIDPPLNVNQARDIAVIATTIVVATKGRSTIKKISSRSGKGAGRSLFDRGKSVFDNFDIDSAYVKPKHLSTTSGGSRQFLGGTKLEAEAILRDAMRNGNITSITDNGLTTAGNQSYEIIIDAGKSIGTRGENLVKIILSEDGGMLSAYPIK